MNEIAVIDYGMGNLHSMAKALETVADGHRVRIVDTPEAIERADRLVFPGVGAMSACMQALRERGLLEAIRQAANDRPFLGVCLGMQALFEHSEEGGASQGLGLLKGRVRRFEAEAELKIPHMGWNRVCATAEHPVLSGLNEAWFYFVHSYYCEPAEPSAIAGECRYGRNFCAAVSQDKLFAVQFHPEKSQGDGLRLLRNFVHWRP
ncbi:imidazole glycerol phosphate synthase subunit HisH [Natronospira bacteriovora]|uniref:Imidazole glycerol phosphate synthase subunit HisH n=1 Tax=Natronospira bacteriovora TaxID=3069753 RepID=A0ABU0W6L7_9GAMM|nr:imidazole glycerol phosphate synthase subunit HisH [Natronospira sp. AB-CW4]MDQ2069669.1 imidazole glycerol phosphate synthase subunit HisH [Natronospira sp. AB-CW4]